MKAYLLAYVIIITLMTGCGLAPKQHPQILIDPTIQQKVELTIIDTFPKKPRACALHYLNKMDMEFYINDSLKAVDMPPQSFKSFWEAKKDTVHISGSFGSISYGELGFEMIISKEAATVYFSTCPHIMRQFSFTENGDLEFDIKVPTVSSSITLSNPPDSLFEGNLYGLVEFESKEFFQMREMKDGKEIGPRNRVKSKMKVYFKAGRCDSL